MSETGVPARPSGPDPARGPDAPTLVAASALAYLLSLALHEHVGHAVACVALGGRLRGMGAFYVDCDDAGLAGLAVRAVALAGPLASLISGLVAFRVLRGVSPAARLPYYFVWLLGSVALMSAAGYPLFSGVTGVGDLGTTADGALYGVRPEVLWRAILVGFGVYAYTVAVRHMCRTMRPLAGAAGSAELDVLRRATRVSYVAGAALYALIGAVNPKGWEIILLSVLTSSLGGTSGLIWMWGMYRRRFASPGTGLGLGFGRSAAMIVTAAAAALAYGVVLGPTLAL